MKTHPYLKHQAIVVPSGGISPSGRLPFFVKYRLDEAYKKYHAGMAPRIIVLGKWSYHLEAKPKLTESEAMAKYLIDLGVQKADILKENQSIDLISSAIYLKKNILKPRRLKSLYIITSDFHEERIEYVFKKILGKDYLLTFKYILSRLTPELLWHFFIYDRETLLNTQKLLQKHQLDTNTYLTNNYLRLSFYSKKVSGFIPDLIHVSRTGKAPKKEPHYSLKSIYRQRLKVFAKYGLNVKRKRTLKADFWSERFLNFLGRDQTGGYYCLKFALHAKDKQSFTNEVKMLLNLKKKGLTFVPEVIDQHINQAPLWYLYKVLEGKMSGEFSRTFSFSDRFYQPFINKKLVNYLLQMRSLKVRSKFVSRWGQSQYSKRQKQIISKLKNYPILHKYQPLILRANAQINQSFKLLEQSAKYLSHNDLHPANIIFSLSKKKLYFIDFEYIGYNNIAFDICFAYLFSWNKPLFQQKLLSSFLDSLTEKERREFHTVFPPVYCHLLLWFLKHTAHWRSENNQYLSRAAEKYAISQLKKYVG